MEIVSTRRGFRVIRVTEKNRLVLQEKASGDGWISLMRIHGNWKPERPDTAAQAVLDVFLCGLDTKEK